MPPKVAVMVVDPGVLAVTSPFVPDVLLTVAIPEFPVPHVTEAVRSWVELSENVPAAANWRVEPAPMVGVMGVMEMDTSDFAVIVAVPETPRVAVIVAEPAAVTVATPREPDALLMVAIPLFDELKSASVVKSCTEPSANVPTAVNCWVEPTTTLGLAGVTAINTGPWTINADVPEMAPYEAVMVAEPIEREEAMPLAVIVAIPASEEFHVTSDVTSRVVLFDKVEIAENC
jgi:hypothetical protein